MCATPDCDLCAEEEAAEALDAAVVGVPCGDVFDPGDGATACVLPRGHEGGHTDGGDAWSNP